MYNYDPNATHDNMLYGNLGCTNPDYIEYNENANVDDGSCLVMKIEGCMNDLYIEFNPDANHEMMDHALN